MQGGNELDFDNSFDNYDDSRILARTNILDGFENFENEYLKFIEENRNKLYSKFYNQIEFKEKNVSNKRFCSFCLTKKVSLFLIYKPA
jgi:predicted enzyme involved in methoxymalonyl-ACP biosynthesis